MIFEDFAVNVQKLLQNVCELETWIEPMSELVSLSAAFYFEKLSQINFTKNIQNYFL